jgi:hypothetical protein
MGQPIRITAGTVTLAAELNDSPSAAAIPAALPIRSRGNRWGDEIYFSIPVRQKLAGNARADMQVGELGYWPPGEAFCIFFGRTPASIDERPRAASAVNPIGRVLGDATALQAVPDGAEVIVEKA